MEVRGNYQHRFELRELSRSLGGYRIVIDEAVPENEIHIIRKYPIHIATGGQPGKGGSTVLVDMQVYRFRGLADCA